MRVPTCPDCGCNLEKLTFGNGGYIYVRAVPGLLLPDENGPHEGIEPRELKKIRGRLVSLEEGLKLQESGQRVLQVWMRHDRHPDGPARAPLATPTKEKQISTGSLF